MKKPLTQEENARQATIKILEILDEYNCSERQARIIFDIIMDDFTYTTHGLLEEE